MTLSALLIALQPGVSEFENDLLKNLCDKLAKSNMQATQKLLICLVFDKLDDFKGVMSKVKIAFSSEVSNAFSVSLLMYVPKNYSIVC